jgi:hypothetical protein
LSCHPPRRRAHSLSLGYCAPEHRDKPFAHSAIPQKRRSEATFVGRLDCGKRDPHLPKSGLSQRRFYEKEESDIIMQLVAYRYHLQLVPLGIGSSGAVGFCKKSAIGIASNITSSYLQPVV